MNQQEAQKQFQEELFAFQKATAFPSISLPAHFSDWVRIAMLKYSPAKLNFPVPDYEEVFNKTDNKYNLYQLANIIWMLDQQSPNDMAMAMLDYISMQKVVVEIGKDIAAIVEPEVVRIQRKINTLNSLAQPQGKRIPIGKA